MNTRRLCEEKELPSFSWKYHYAEIDIHILVLPQCWPFSLLVIFIKHHYSHYFRPLLLQSLRTLLSVLLHSLLSLSLISILALLTLM